MSEWNISGDGMTIEQSKRRSPMRWLRDNSLKLAIVIGLSEAAVAYFKGFHFLWAIGLLAVFGYWWIRNRVPQSVRRPLWVVATSQAIAGLVVPAVFAGLVHRRHRRRDPAGDHAAGAARRPQADLT